MRLILAIFVAVLVSCAPQSTVAPTATSTRSAAPAATAIATFDGARAKAHVDYLADPARGGRYTGSAGFRDAATYVAEQFRQIGLEPFGDGGTYFQNFKMPIVDLTETSALSIGGQGVSARALRARVDFTESVGGRSGAGSAEAGIAVVGGGAKGGGHDDFAGADVRGKIALVTGPRASGGGSPVENAYQEGAIGALIVGNATLRYSFLPRLQRVTIPTLVIAEQVARELLAPSGKTLAQVEDAFRARRTDQAAPAAGFNITATARMSVSLTEVREIEAFNVVGLLRAPTEEGARRAVLLGGHLDGVGTDPDGSVFPAANDNAAGPSVVMEVARALAPLRGSLGHSIIFVAFGGEEEGLFGSEVYVAQTLTTPGRVATLIAMLNLDVVGCCSDTLIVSNENPELQRKVRETAAGLGVLTESVEGGGSDQTPFARRGVPAVLIGSADYILHVYADTPSIVQSSRLKKAGDVVTNVARALANGR